MAKKSKRAAKRKHAASHQRSQSYRRLGRSWFGKPNHKHTPLAMEFYLHAHGDANLPPTGIEIERDSFDQFGVEHDLLTLAKVKSDDLRYRQAMHERDLLRKKINSGACCIDVPPNRQYRVEIERGKLLMFPASDLARNRLEGLGERAVRGLEESSDETENIIKVLSLTARSESATGSNMSSRSMRSATPKPASRPWRKR